MGIYISKIDKIALFRSFYTKINVNWRRIEAFDKYIFILWTNWLQISIKDTIKTSKSGTVVIFISKIVKIALFQSFYTKIDVNLRWIEAFDQNISILFTHWPQISLKTTIKNIKSGTLANYISKIEKNCTFWSFYTKIDVNLPQIEAFWPKYFHPMHSLTTNIDKNNHKKT